MTNVQNIDNILVNQKNRILNLINGAEVVIDTTSLEDVVRCFRCALFTLNTVKFLWVQEGYGYKFNELVRRIDDICFAKRSRLAPQAKKQQKLLDEIYQECKLAYVPQTQELV